MSKIKILVSRVVGDKKEQKILEVEGKKISEGIPQRAEVEEYSMDEFAKKYPKRKE